jgi:hypothetical protein
MIPQQSQKKIRSGFHNTAFHFCAAGERSFAPIGRGRDDENNIEQ